MTDEKFLMIMRHAKSDRTDGESDIERPLNEKGEKDSKIIGSFLKETGFIPDAILSSKAKRAFDTAKIVGRKIEFLEENIVSDIELYSANVNELINIIENLDENIRNVLIVGHNPAMEQTASSILGASSFEMTTASLACFSSEGSWRNFRQEASFKFFIYPKLVKRLV
ncbi:MAG TPA: histidine phosphatase family protein [Victivallales bacterium]|nr:histidine phosphatase family protein [Victivallales bacterium]